jgi:hypothetical protein
VQTTNIETFEKQIMTKYKRKCDTAKICLMSHINNYVTHTFTVLRHRCDVLRHIMHVLRCSSCIMSYVLFRFLADLSNIVNLLYAYKSDKLVTCINQFCRVGEISVLFRNIEWALAPADYLVGLP